ncbi:hypothetical protein D3C74_290970 [compost metagenome]
MLTRSSFGFEVSETFTKYFRANGMTRATSGTIPMKIQRHDRCSMTKPAKVGPIAGATIMARPMSPMAAPRPSLGNTTNTTIIKRGMIMPAPAAWISRPVKRNGKLGAMALMNVPTSSRSMEQINNWRVVNRCMRNAVTGTKIPFTSMKPVISH